MTAFALVLLAIFAIWESGAIHSGLPCARRDRGDTFDCVCNASYCDTIQVPEALDPQWMYVYTSSASKHRFDLKLRQLQVDPDRASDVEVNISPEDASQEVVGFGGALTDATGHNIAMLPSSARDKFFDSYFSKDGIEFSMVRVPIGGTDFSSRFYTNLNADAEVKLVEEDCHYKIPYVREILKRNENVKLLGSSWQAPEWMLENDKSRTKSIKPEYYRLWAEYHKRFFDLYKGFGIEFWGATTGNEIVVGAFSVPWEMREHQTWINEHLGPVLEESGYGDIKLLLLDDQTPYVAPWQSLLKDNVTDKYIDGVAVHWYLDDKIYLVLVPFHYKFPNKQIFNTEASLCAYEENFEEKKQWYGAELYADNIMEKLNYYGNGWIDWNLALDMEGGPNYKNNTCTAAVIVNAEREEFYKGPIFYALGHFSKFIPPGSRRIKFSKEPQNKDLRVAAFSVEDHPWNVVVVFLNKLNKEMEVKICISKERCGIIHLPARSIVSAIANTSSTN